MKKSLARNQIFCFENGLKLTYSQEEFQNFPGEDPLLKGRGEEGRGGEGTGGQGKGKKGGEGKGEEGEGRGGEKEEIWGVDLPVQLGWLDATVANATNRH